MTRSKLSTKVILLATFIGLPTAAFAGAQPAAAQSFLDEYECPIGSVYDPTYGCTVAGEAYQPYDYGYYGYLPYGAYHGHGGDTSLNTRAASRTRSASTGVVTVMPSVQPSMN